MTDPDRKIRDLELLKKSRQALHDDQNQVSRRQEDEVVDESAESENGMMYRGRPVRSKGAGPKVPGAGAGRPVSGRGGTFRGAGRGNGGAAGPKGATDVKQVLQKLSDLRESGLITKAEYDKKRAQILDRL